MKSKPRILNSLSGLATIPQDNYKWEIVSVGRCLAPPDAMTLDNLIEQFSSHLSNEDITKLKGYKPKD